MNQRCPHCQQSISSPSLSCYEDFFACPHCRSALAHRETDILLYAFTFIAIMTTVLVTLVGVNSLIAVILSMSAYHFLRPKYFEPRFRIKIANPPLDLLPNKKPVTAATGFDNMDDLTSSDRTSLCSNSDRSQPYQSMPDTA